MRTFLLVTLFALATTAGAHADNTMETHETAGLDVTTSWEPANRDAFGAGPLFRFEWYSSHMPSWLGIVTRFGVIADSADRVIAPFHVGLLFAFGGTGLYATLETGGLLHDEFTAMDSRMIISDRGAVAAGWRFHHWDVRASLERSQMYDGNVWLFSLGRDFERTDATIRRTSLF